LKVFVCGASGFIGSAICQRLAADGHVVVRGVRTPGQAGDVAIDFGKDIEPEAWTARLAGVDGVVNAVGIIVETRGSCFENVHQRAPTALFEGCARTGVRRVVQISALGADGGDTVYFKSKLAADRALMALPLQWTIRRPSLVYGEEGDSSRMFRVFASMPVIPVPDLGTALFQPVHVDELAESVSACLRTDAANGLIVDVVGGNAVSYRDTIDTYRRAMGFGAALYVTVPAFLMAVSAWASGFVPGAPLNPETWRMLKAGSAGDAAGITRLLGHRPKGVAEFIESSGARQSAAKALNEWRPRVLRVGAAIAVVLIIYFLQTRRTL
jgi:uncharacterized protein YbjT (DUF2867 family)